MNEIVSCCLSYCLNVSYVEDAVSKLGGRADFDHFLAFLANKFDCKYFQRPTPTS